MAEIRPPLPDNPFWSCPIQPWVEEFQRRVQEAVAAGTNVVNLSYTHPNGFFPNPIMWRPAILSMVKPMKQMGWQFDTARAPPAAPYPYHHIWLPPSITADMLEYCDTKPFEQEMDLRRAEAWEKGYWLDLGDEERGMKWCPASPDFNNYHPRGGIPDIIMKRIERRKDPKWRDQMREEIQRLQGDANKDDALAKTMEAKIEGVLTRPEGPGDPTPLRNAIAEAKARAERSREVAKHYRHELGEAA